MDGFTYIRIDDYYVVIDLTLHEPISIVGQDNRFDTQYEATELVNTLNKWYREDLVGAAEFSTVSPVALFQVMQSPN